jgi:hypothetical protein
MAYFRKDATCSGPSGRSSTASGEKMADPHSGVDRLVSRPYRCCSSLRRAEGKGVGATKCGLQGIKSAILAKWPLRGSAGGQVGL